MWKCPVCGRAFLNQNQWHSCVSISPDELFPYLPKSVKALYEHLLKRCRAFCDFSIDTTKSCLYLVDEYRFIVIKPKKSGLTLEFVLNRKEEVFPVIKTIDIGKGRFVHCVKLDAKKDLTDQILSWIKDA